MAAEVEIWKPEVEIWKPLFSAVPHRINCRMWWDSHLCPQHLHPASAFFTAAPCIDRSDIRLSGTGWGSVRRWKINKVYRDGSQEADDVWFREKVGCGPCTPLTEHDRSIVSKYQTQCVRYASPRWSFANSTGNPGTARFIPVPFHMTFPSLLTKHEPRIHKQSHTLQVPLISSFPIKHAGFSAEVQDHGYLKV